MIRKYVHGNVKNFFTKKHNPNKEFYVAPFERAKVGFK